MSCLRGGMAKIVRTGPKPHGLLVQEFPKGLAVAAPRPAIADQEQVLSIRLAGARTTLGLHIEDRTQHDGIERAFEPPPGPISCGSCFFMVLVQKMSSLK